MVLKMVDACGENGPFLNKDALASFDCVELCAFDIQLDVGWVLAAEEIVESHAFNFN